MSASLEHAIQERLRRLSDEQKRQVMAFVDRLNSEACTPSASRFSFVGIARSGNGSLSTEHESILNEAADRSEGWSIR